MVRREPAPDGAADSIFAFWTDIHDLRRRNDVSMPELVRALNSNRSTVYELGKEGSKTNQYQGVEFVANAIRALKVPEAQWEEWISRYRALEVARDVEQVRPGPSWKQLWLAVVVTGLVAAGVGVVVTYVLTPMPTSEQAAADRVVVEVQNKVALGANELREDLTPAYLSSRTERRCASPEKNCKLAGTEMASGVLLVATCQKTGDELVNYNIDANAEDNPHRAKSDRWYKIKLPDGIDGFISEVYIRQEDRGGLGLPRCR